MNTLSAHLLSFPLCTLSIRTLNNKIYQITFLEKINHQDSNDPLIQQLKNELTMYFKNPLHPLDIDFEITVGTPFQKKVWEAISKIPSGKTITYGELAIQLHTSPRAIGNACRTNPVPLIIPCHRVVGKNSLGGFVGAQEGTMVTIKQKLLEHEQLA